MEPPSTPEAAPEAPPGAEEEAKVEEEPRKRPQRTLREKTRKDYAGLDEGGAAAKDLAGLESDEEPSTPVAPKKRGRPKGSGKPKQDATPKGARSSWII